MSKKGGYLIIDLKNIDLNSRDSDGGLYDWSNNSGLLPDLYNELEQNYFKQVLVTGIKINGIERNDFITTIYLNGSSYSFNVYGFTVNIVDKETMDVGTSLIIHSIHGNIPTDGIIKINYGEFPYSKRLSLRLSLSGTTIIQTSFDVWDGAEISSGVVIFSDGTYAVTLDATEREYFIIKVSGGPVTNSNYEIAFLG